MDRRKALGLAAALPAAFAARSASACSLAVDSPETYSARLPEVSRLFDAWFRRDELAFLGKLVGPRTTSGEASEDFVRRAIAASEDKEPQRLFATMFTDTANYKQLLSLNAIGDNIFAAVTEQEPGGTGPDCSNMPTLHLFLIGYRAGRPSTLELVRSETWTGYAQTASWTAPR